MSYLRRVRVFARLWFGLNLIMAVLLIFSTYQAHAIGNLFGSKPQPGGGRPADGRTAGPLAPGVAAQNPEAFLINLTEEVRNRFANGARAAEGRDMEIRQLEFGLENRSQSVLLLGNARSGRTSIVQEYTRRHLDTVTVLKLNMDQIYKLPPEQQGQAVKEVLQHIERLTGNSSAKVVFYLDNVKALHRENQGASGVGALIEALGFNRQVSMIMEVDAVTNGQTFHKSEAIYSQLTIVEPKPPVYDAVLQHLERALPQLESERRGRVQISMFAIEEAARIAVRNNAASPFEAAVGYLRQAMRLAEDEVNAETSKRYAVESEMARNRQQAEMLKREISRGDNPQLRERLSKLEARHTELVGQLAKMAAPTPTVQQEIVALEREIAEEEAQVKPDKKKIEEKTLRKLKLKDQDRTAAPGDAPVAGPKQVLQAAAEILKVPVENLASDAGSSLANIERISTDKHVVGQDHIIERAKTAVPGAFQERAQIIKEAQIKGITPSDIPPYWSSVLGGDPGTGKTEFAKQLAKALGMTFTRFDMSEYMEQHSTARMIGSPPGYVGFEEGGRLTEAVRNRPYQVLLFDEIEKAHPRVFDLFLQILSDGRLTDGQGRTVSFENTLILMTTNLGHEFVKMDRVELIKHILENGKHPPATEMAIMTDNQLRGVALKQVIAARFRPEIADRVSDYLVTNSHTAESMREIAQKMMRTFSNRIQTVEGVKVVITEAAMEALVRSQGEGASVRSLQQAFKRNITEPINAKLSSMQERQKVMIIDVGPSNSFEYSLAETPHFYSAQTAGNTYREDRLKIIQKRIADAGKIAQTNRPGLFRAFDPEFMIRNATMRALKGKLK